MKVTEILKSASLVNILTDSQMLLVPFIAPGVKLPRKYSYFRHPSINYLSLKSIFFFLQSKYAYIVVSFFRERATMTLCSDNKTDLLLSFYPSQMGFYRSSSTCYCQATSIVASRLFYCHYGPFPWRITGITCYRFFEAELP